MAYTRDEIADYAAQEANFEFHIQVGSTLVYQGQENFELTIKRSGEWMCFECFKDGTRNLVEHDEGLEAFKRYANSKDWAFVPSGKMRVKHRRWKPVLDTRRRPGH